MSDETKKPGFLARLFGRGAKVEPPPPPPPLLEPELQPATEPAPTPQPLPAPEVPGDRLPAVGATVDPALVPVASEPEAVPAAPSSPSVDMPPETPAAVAEEVPIDAVQPAPAPLPEPVQALPPSPSVAPAPAAKPELEAIAGPAAVAAADVAPAPKKSWWTRLSEGLSRTSSQLTTGITDLFTKRKLDAGTLDDLEDILIQADLGVDTAARVAKVVGSSRYEKGISGDEVRAILAREVGDILKPVAMPLTVDRSVKPFVILMVGVNGSGKTTTIGKLAAKFRAEGRSVMLAAGDTFRAAAIEQLKVWGTRTGAEVIAREQGSDAAGLAFDALTAARAAGTDVLLVDTAGRLQNRTELMEELAKVVRVIRKIDAAAPHAVLLVLDATVGQNALTQVEVFRQMAGVTGLVMTKLDGTARGGILVSLASKFALPVHFIGVGEGVDDLEPFDADEFARAVAGLERAA